MFGRSRLLMLGLPLLALFALIAAVLSIARSNATVEAVPARSAPPATPGAQSVIGAQGAVEPAGQEVAVATRSAGVVTKVLVVPGQKVAPGDLLFVVDPALAEITITQRESDLAIAEARLAETRGRITGLMAERDVARAGITAAEAELEEARDLVRIGAQLQSSTAITAREIDKRRHAERAANARVTEARARLLKAETDLALLDPATGATFKIEEGNVAQAKAALDLAKAQRAERDTRAPSQDTISQATILSVNIRPGEFVQTGVSPAPVTLGLLEPLHIRVDIDEADIPRFKAGDAATALPRGEPGRVISLKFLRAEPVVTPKRSLSGLSTDRVDTRVLQILYQVEGAAPTLRPGQVVDVFIKRD